MNNFIKLIGLLAGLTILAGCATEVGVGYVPPPEPVVYYGWYGGYYGPYYWNGPVIIYGAPHGWHGHYYYGGPRHFAPPPPHRGPAPGAPAPRPHGPPPQHP